MKYVSLWYLLLEYVENEKMTWKITTKSAVAHLGTELNIYSEETTVELGVINGGGDATHLR